jgi:hypothetical protein
MVDLNVHSQLVICLTIIRARNQLVICLKRFTIASIPINPRNFSKSNKTTYPLRCSWPELNIQHLKMSFTNPWRGNEYPYSYMHKRECNLVMSSCRVQGLLTNPFIPYGKLSHILSGCRPLAKSTSLMPRKLRASSLGFWGALSIPRVSLKASGKGFFSDKNYLPLY